MGIVVDIILVAIIALAALVGFKRGLALSLIRIASFVITIILVFMLTKPVANLVKSETQIDENLKKSLYNMFMMRNEDTAREEVKEEKAEEAKKPLDEFSFKLTDDVRKEIAKRQEELAETASEKTKETIITFVVAAILFVVFRIIFLIIGVFVAAVTELPVVYQVDKAGGIIYGLLEGLFISFIFLTIIYLINIPLADNGVTKAVESSFVTSLLYNHNPITMIFFK